MVSLTSWFRSPGLMPAGRVPAQEQGYQPHYSEYPMGHEISPAVFARLVEWITQTLPPQPQGPSEPPAS